MIPVFLPYDVKEPRCVSDWVFHCSSVCTDYTIDSKTGVDGWACVGAIRKSDNRRVTIWRIDAHNLQLSDRERVVDLLHYQIEPTQGCPSMVTVLNVYDGEDAPIYVVEDVPPENLALGQHRNESFYLDGDGAELMILRAAEAVRWLLESRCSPPLTELTFLTMVEIDADFRFSLGSFLSFPVKYVYDDRELLCLTACFFRTIIEHIHKEMIDDDGRYQLKVLGERVMRSLEALPCLDPPPYFPDEGRADINEMGMDGEAEDPYGSNNSSLGHRQDNYLSASQDMPDIPEMQNHRHIPIAVGDGSYGGGSQYHELVTP
ncbi:hypothetical protein GMRT_10192 [Giardia muris]|uniref:Uncharacterized protein n=1 Tax=Giardia muris TaxID=5742 RepID=A0A4Z1SMD8_GIAMU|nr:hypothetical protein GMRT_10192 [Giardia muris]|eukprot:TNJ26740.1 hypothetical protein GMRT_10192 [Giardia muris]